MSSFTTDLKYEPTGTISQFGLPNYRLLEAFTYFVGSIENPLTTIYVPQGFITDFASIPWPMNIWFKPTGKWAKAAALHDWLYSTYPEIEKMIPDSIFYEGCLVLKVNIFIAIAFFLVLRVVSLFSGR